MPRSVGPGGPRATAESLDQVLMLIVLVMFMLLELNFKICLDGWTAHFKNTKQGFFQRTVHSGMRSSELLRKSVGKKHPIK